MTDLRVPLPIPLETVVCFTTLGVRFWDAARETAIGPGLVVLAWPEDEPLARPVRATLTRGGVYAFHNLPGMRAIERPAGDRAPESPPFTRRFVVEVRDTEGRYLPAVFRVDLPYTGIYPTGALGSPNAGRPPGFYLFSAPARPATGLAVVRAELLEHVSRQPAAYALLEVSAADGLWYGIANENGLATVIFTYPSFGPTPESPPLSPAAAHTPQHWPVTVRVFYEPAAQQVPPGADLPDLASIFAQAPANVRPTAGGPAAAELAADLSFGRELVLASAPLSTLLVG